MNSSAPDQATLPPELATGTDAPALPPEPLTDQAVAKYILRLHGTHDDCAATLRRMAR